MKSCKTKHLRMGILHKNRYRSKDSSKNDFHFILPEWKLMKTFFFHGETEFHFTSLVTSSPSPTINLNKFFWTVIDTFEVTLSFFRSFFKSLAHYQTGVEHAIPPGILFNMYLQLHQVLFLKSEGILVNMGVKSLISRDKNMILFGICLKSKKVTIL